MLVSVNPFKNLQIYTDREIDIYQGAVSNILKLIMLACQFSILYFLLSVAKIIQMLIMYECSRSSTDDGLSIHFNLMSYER